MHKRDYLKLQKIVGCLKTKLYSFNANIFVPIDNLINIYLERKKRKRKRKKRKKGKRKKEKGKTKFFRMH